MDRILRWAILCFVMSASLQACTTDASEMGPAQSSTKKGVTLLLEARLDGRCCLVTSVNPGDASTIVLCFVDVFDDADRFLSTTLVPPKPAGHRRSSGFEAPPGPREHGFQEIPLDLSDQHFASDLPSGGVAPGCPDLRSSVAGR